MTLKLYPKPSLETFIKSCTPLAIIETLESEMQERVETIASALLQYTASDDPVENLAEFLRADEDFLGIALALTNLSQEKFLRILSAERFAQGDFGREWGREKVFRKLQDEPDFARRIARLLLDGRNSPLLIQQVARFYLDQLSLSEEWAALLQDPKVLYRIIRQKLSGEYSDKKGDAIETLIRDYLDFIETKYGVSHSKGQVGIVKKEVDHAIPSIDEPYVLIMTSYMETTSSSQTARANEQRDMYVTIQGHNIRYPVKRVFVNFVDGGGWLARRSDLRKMYAGCDYIINLKTLDQLEAIICQYVPEKYFVKQSKPDVEVI